MVANYFNCIVFDLIYGFITSIERIQNGTKQSFNYSISGVDSIIGPRSSPIALVLYTIFHIGNQQITLPMKLLNI